MPHSVSYTRPRQNFVLIVISDTVAANDNTLLGEKIHHIVFVAGTAVAADKVRHITRHTHKTKLERTFNHGWGTVTLAENVQGI